MVLKDVVCTQFTVAMITENITIIYFSKISSSSLRDPVLEQCEPDIFSHFYILTFHVFLFQFFKTFFLTFSAV